MNDKFLSPYMCFLHGLSMAPWSRRLVAILEFIVLHDAPESIIMGTRSPFKDTTVVSKLLIEDVYSSEEELDSVVWSLATWLILFLG